MARPTVTVEVPWWAKPDQIFYNTQYEEEPNAQQMLSRADVIVIFFGLFLKRNTRLLGKYLSQFQKKVNSSGGKMQLILSSMDENEKECQLFANTLEGDWLVIPWSNQVARRTARMQCNVNRPPAVVALNNEGEGIVVSTEAKVEILELGEAAYLKWKQLHHTPSRIMDVDAFDSEHEHRRSTMSRPAPK